MSRRPLIDRPFRSLVGALSLLAVLVACDSSDPLGPSDSSASVIAGTVELAGAAAVESPDLSGILISIDGGTASTVTDSAGAFRLVTVGEAGTVRLRFQRGSINAEIEIQGATPGTELRIQVRLDSSGGTVVDDSRRGLVEFEGRPTLVTLSGSSPNRVLRISVVGTRTRNVDVFEASTVFEARGDILTFSSLVGALGSPNLRVEGDATLAEDGTYDAVSIKPEIDDGERDDQSSRDDDRCVGTMTGTFDDDLFVPSGATCTLSNALVRANVKALEGAVLYVIDSRVIGNVQGDEASIVHVVGGTVVGNIQIEDGRSSGQTGALVRGTVVEKGNIQIEKMRTGRITVEDARVLQGNLQVVENEVSGSLDLWSNVVAGNLQVFKNRGAGDKVVRDNRVSQTVQCKENTGPFTGGPNDAGETEDQCF